MGFNFPFFSGGFQIKTQGLSSPRPPRTTSNGVVVETLHSLLHHLGKECSDIRRSFILNNNPDIKLHIPSGKDESLKRKIHPNNKHV